MAQTIVVCSSSDSSSTASSSINNDHIKVSTPKNGRANKKHSKPSNAVARHHSITEQQRQTASSPTIPQPSRPHPSMSSALLPKTVSCSIADLSLSSHHQKTSAAAAASVRFPTFQSKLDISTVETYKKIPLSQSFDWGMLAITNTDLILLYNKDKTSLVIFDANGHENEVRK